MKIVSKEQWNDGSVVPWEVEVREIPLDEETLSEYYDRDCKSNEEVVKDGGIIRAFVVEKVLVVPDTGRAEDEEEPIAACEFLGVVVGDKLVVLMNHREYVEKLYGTVVQDFSPWPTLLNIQDCGFDVEVEEN